MNVVQSVIPISSVLILVGEGMHLVDLVQHRRPPPVSGAVSLADGTH
jgi:hypothetical protein